MDAAMRELVRQAETKAKLLESETGSAPAACPAHRDLANGVACSLRLLVVLARREGAPPPRRITWAGVGAAIGAAVSGFVSAVWGGNKP